MVLEHKLGTSTTSIKIDSKQQCQKYSLDLAVQAKRSLLITSYELDHVLYDNERFIDIVAALAASNRHTAVKILFQNSERLIHHGHRLVTLSRRLTSHIFIRKFGKDQEDYHEAVLIVDGMGYLHRPLADRFEGKVCYADPSFAKQQVNFFELAWQHSEEDADIRRLTI